MAIAREDSRLTVLDHHERAIAIVLDFMNPVLALRRLIDQGRKLWLDESEPCEQCGYAGHTSFVVGRVVSGRGN
jgi:hypothetical protein